MPTSPAPSGARGQHLPLLEGSSPRTAAFSQTWKSYARSLFLPINNSKVARSSRAPLMPRSDPDIYRAANLLVKQHGDEAPIHAAMRADIMLEEGDLDGRRV